MTCTIRLRVPGAATCVGCRFFETDSGSHGSGYPMCIAFDGTQKCISGIPQRLPECIEAEASQAATERDADAWRRIVAILPRPARGPETQAELMQDIANMTEEFINRGGTKRSHVGRILDAIAAELRGRG
jgi:hypothetical protein